MFDACVRSEDAEDTNEMYFGLQLCNVCGCSEHLVLLKIDFRQFFPPSFGVFSTGTLRHLFSSHEKGYLLMTPPPKCSKVVRARLFSVFLCSCTSRTCCAATRAATSCSAARLIYSQTLMRRTHVNALRCTSSTRTQTHRFHNLKPPPSPPPRGSSSLPSLSLTHSQVTRVTY